MSQQQQQQQQRQQQQSSERISDQQMQINEQNRKVVLRMFETYNRLSQLEKDAQNKDPVLCANLNVQISRLLLDTVANQNLVLSSSMVRFLTTEGTSRAMQAILIKSSQMSGLADISLSLASQQKLAEDLRKAQININNSPDDSSSNEISDPADGMGLYQVIMPKQLQNTDNLNKLVGYGEQHKQLLSMYFIISDSTNRVSTICFENAAAVESGSNANNEEIREISNPRRGNNIILYGPPGTGKTTAARAMAGTLGLPFIYVNSQNISSAYRGESEKNLNRLFVGVRALAEQLKSNLIILFDEVDGIVRNRVGEISASDLALLTLFLQLLDPNDSSDNSKLTFIFTTNRLDSLDSAFQRRCSKLLMGYVTSLHERAKLFCSFFNDTNVDFQNAPVDTIQQWYLSIAKQHFDLVPGDLTNFVNDTIEGERLNMYLRNNNFTYEQYIQNRKNVNDRIIKVPLPKVKSSWVEMKLNELRPTTPREDYDRLYNPTITAEQVANNVD